jgi:hypothetical protein
LVVKRRSSFLHRDFVFGSGTGLHSTDCTDPTLRELPAHRESGQFLSRLGRAALILDMRSSFWKP